MGPTAFADQWHSAAMTSLGLFWTAFWAFGLGYLISSLIQVFVTRERMQKSMGKTGPKSVALGALFGFISSSCSFAALATTRSLFTKGAGLIPSLAFLLASTNLVIELGVVIAVFLSWPFVVGEYVGGLLLILLMWLVVRLSHPRELIARARAYARREAEDEDEASKASDWKQLATSREGWRRVAQRYVMEWKMVWKDVTVGFTVAGIIAVFVPKSFFQTLFVGTASGENGLGLWEVSLQALVGPVAAFFTFIGSMGNIPLAAVLFGHGVSFAGVMAFIFSDLVVFPVLRIQANYYGWRMAMYLLGVLFVVLVTTALLLHYGFEAFGLLPDPASAQRLPERRFFAIDHTLFLDLGFLVLSLACLVSKVKNAGWARSGHQNLGDKALLSATLLALAWLAGGVVVAPFL